MIYSKLPFWIYLYIRLKGNESLLVSFQISTALLARECLLQFVLLYHYLIQDISTFPGKTVVQYIKIIRYSNKDRQVHLCPPRQHAQQWYLS